MASGVKGTFDGGDEAVVGQSTRIRGRISGEGDLRVEGAIEGGVALDGAVLVAEGGSIEADVEATSLIVEGTVEGDVSLGEALAIRASGRVSGVIRAAGVSIEEGASVSGRVEMDFDMPEELNG